MARPHSTRDANRAGAQDREIARGRGAHPVTIQGMRVGAA